MDTKGGRPNQSVIPAERSPEIVVQSRSPHSSLVEEEGVLPQQLADSSLNHQLLEQLNGQYEKQLQLVANERMDDDGLKLSVYVDWVASLRTINTELVESLREMQDTCLERMQLMRANYLKDLVRFGPDIRLKQLHPVGGDVGDLVGRGENQSDDRPASDRTVSLELSSNYPIVPTTDGMLLGELELKSRELEELRKKLADQRQLTDDRGLMVEQLRNLAKERDKQLDDKCKEMDILQHQISLLNAQLVKAKMSAAALTDNKSLISEITDHHDKITQLKQKLKEQEDKLRQANIAIQYRDGIISHQRQEIKMLNEQTTLCPARTDTPLQHCTSSDSEGLVLLPVACSSSGYHSIRSDPVDGSTIARASSNQFFDTIQKQSETESEYVAMLKQELFDMREQLHEYKRSHSATCNAERCALESFVKDRDTSKALLRLRNTCEELLQSTEKFCLAETAAGETVASGNELRFVDDEELIEALRDRCEVLCRKLAEHAAGGDQDEGIGSTTTSRLGNVSEDQHPQTVCHERHCAEVVVGALVIPAKRVLGKETVNSASESLSSFSLGPDEGCAMQGLIDDLKKEIESKDLVLRDRHVELERAAEKLASRDRQLQLCRAKQEALGGQTMTLQNRIDDLEQSVDDQCRIVTMLKAENSKLIQQAEDLKETLQQYRDNLQKTSEEKVAIEDECKNQLVTISNLRVALEETKRSGSSSVNVLHEVVESLQLEVMLLSEQLNASFKENIAKDNELDNYRDSNLQLRCQLAEMSRELGDLKDMAEAVDIRHELSDQKSLYFALLKNDVKQMQDQLNGVRCEIVSRQQDLGHLSFFREKCAEMERIHEVELSQQRSKHSNELKDLRREIEQLSNQLATSMDSSKHHEQTVQELATLQATILELGDHNEVLQKTIQSYQDSIVQLEQQFGASDHQLSGAKLELEELRSRCNEQENKIGSLKADRDRLVGELATHKRMCKCGFNNGSGSRERAKTPLSHSLQKQLDAKTREASRAQEELLQRCEEWKKREAEYVVQRVQATEQATRLIEQLSELKGRNSILEQSIFTKCELLDRLQHNLRDVNRTLAMKLDLLTEVDTKNANLADALEKARKDALMCEKRCMEELSNVRRSSMDQKNQLQQYESQNGRLRAEVDALREKCEHIANEREALKDETQGLRERLATFEGKESALCEVVKSNQNELAIKSSRLLELEETNRKLSQNYQQVQGFSADLNKQYQRTQLELEQMKECSSKLLEFKQQTLNTKDITRKSIAEWKEREARYNQEILRLKKRTEMLEQDRTKLVTKLEGYHRDNTILSRRVHQAQQQPARQHSPYDENRRSNNLTPLHQTFYPPEAYRLARSSSDPNCNEPNDLLHKVEFTCSQLQQIRKFWHQGIKQAFPTEP
ncbi:rootletin-like [Anopheles cruzii]|uniref:rootletin-like n=1 Tax=Anopheles cruzii TaxID=68878 RepID=UPI0022EC7E03|nr:rootletin-like [Anopheles cruzii]